MNDMEHKRLKHASAVIQCGVDQCKGLINVVTDTVTTVGALDQDTWESISTCLLGFLTEIQKQAGGLAGTGEVIHLPTHRPQAPPMATTTPQQGPPG